MTARSMETTSWIKAYDWIKEGIESCRLKMGEQLPEMYLVKEIGVSRTPIREAMRVLEQEGYIKIISNKGAFVSKISVNDIKEIYEIRKLLEPFAALSAANRIPELISQLWNANGGFLTAHSEITAVLISQGLLLVI